MRTFAVWYTGYDADNRRQIGCMDQVEALNEDIAGDIVEDVLLGEGFLAVEIGELNDQA